MMVVVHHIGARKHHQNLRVQRGVMMQGVDAASNPDTAAPAAAAVGDVEHHALAFDGLVLSLLLLLVVIPSTTVASAAYPSSSSSPDNLSTLMVDIMLIQVIEVTKVV